MGFKVVVIYDDEEIYARKLMNYINKKVDSLQVQVFTNFENLKEYMEGNCISLLLISKEMLTDSLRELNIEKIVILTTNRGKNYFEEYPTIYKYQSSENFIKEILEYFGPSYEALEGNENTGGSRLIGVYSPIKRCLKTSFALVLGQIYGQEYKTLYLNLERFSGMGVLLGRECSSNLSDVMYYFREKKEGVIENLDSLVERIERLYFIPPVLNPEDIEDIEPYEWQEFFRILLNKSTYKIIIIDFGEGIRGTHEILRMCNKIYMPIKSDQISTIKLEEYEKYLKATNKEDILEKTIKLKLNKEGKIGVRENYIEELMQGDFLAYVKKILEKGGD
ncbi:MAG: hypothetical protein GX913_04545 [Clostridiales bacterium]|nr:hypothetical protein [Clostridiales bacterium]